jgi:hypothetical protein
MLPASAATGGFQWKRNASGRVSDSLISAALDQRVWGGRSISVKNASGHTVSGIIRIIKRDTTSEMSVKGCD